MDTNTDNDEKMQKDKVYQPRTFYHHKTDAVYTIKYKFDHTSNKLTYASCIWKRFSTEKLNVDLWCKSKSYQTASARFKYYPVTIILSNEKTQKLGYYQLRRLEKFILNNLLHQYGVQNKKHDIKILSSIEQKSIDRVFSHILTPKEQEDYKKFQKSRRLLEVLRENAFSRGDLLEVSDFLQNFNHKKSMITPEEHTSYKITEKYISDVMKYLKSVSDNDANFTILNYADVDKPTLKDIHAKINNLGPENFILYLEYATGFTISIKYPV